MTDAEYGLLVSFPDQSETFVLGFEAGQVWQRLESEGDRFAVTIHTANREVMTRMTAVRRWSVTFSDTALAEWTDAEFERGARPVLAVVSERGDTP